MDASPILVSKLTTTYKFVCWRSSYFRKFFSHANSTSNFCFALIRRKNARSTCDHLWTPCQLLSPNLDSSVYMCMLVFSVCQKSFLLRKLTLRLLCCPHQEKECQMNLRLFIDNLPVLVSELTRTYTYVFWFSSYAMKSFARNLTDYVFCLP